MGKLGLVLVLSFIIQNSAFCFDEVYLQKPAGGQFYQEGPSRGKPINEAGCFPTSLAYSIRYQKFVRTPHFENLLAPTGANTSHVDVLDWITYFYKGCHTTEKHGTHNWLQCISNYYVNSGYTSSWVYQIGPFTHKSPPGKNFDRAFTTTDIRNYLNKGYSMILLVEWLDEDTQTPGHWRISEGHAVAVVGYSYNRAWAEDRIILKVMDPGRSYYGRPLIESFSNLTVEKLSLHPKFTLSQNLAKRNYVIRGFGYGYDAYALGTNIIIFAPEQL